MNIEQQIKSAEFNMSAITGTALAIPAFMVVGGIGLALYSTVSDYFPTDQDETTRACMIQQFQDAKFTNFDVTMRRSRVLVEGKSPAQMRVSMELADGKLTPSFPKSEYSTPIPLPIGDTFEPIRVLSDKITQNCLPKAAATPAP